MLLLDIMTEEKRKKPRANIAFPAVMNIQERSVPINIVSISHHVIRIDQKIDIGVNGPCTVFINTKPPTNLECVPIIEEAEKASGHWNRIRIEVPFNLDNVIRLVNTAKRNRWR